MDELNHIFQEYINQGKYPGIQWQSFTKIFVMKVKLVTKT